MDILKTIIFGIIEGITEWLPISSTGHLILAEHFIKFQNVSENFWKLYEVVIQLGAILAVVILYFKNIWPLKMKKSEDGTKKKLKFDKDILNLWGKIIVSCLPAIVIVGLKLDDLADKYFYNPISIAIMLILVGIIFIIIETKYKDKKEEDFRVRTINDLTYKDAIIIGLFQIIAAIFPGTSRSGATIIGALLIGISRVVAAEYTFYLAIPVMAGASLLKVLKYGLNLAGYELMLLGIGMLVAFLVSMLVIKLLMSYIKKHDFKAFGVYRIVFGLIVLAYAFFI